jgi:hypothetical protein
MMKDVLKKNSLKILNFSIILLITLYLYSVFKMYIIPFIIFLSSYYIIKWMLYFSLERFKKTKLIIFPILFVIPVVHFSNTFLIGIYNLSEFIPNVIMHDIQSRVNVMIMFQIFIIVPFLILKTIFKKSETITYEIELEKSALTITFVFLIQTLWALSYKYYFLIYVIPLVLIIFFLIIRNYTFFKN